MENNNIFLKKPSKILVSLNNNKFMNRDVRNISRELLINNTNLYDYIKKMKEMGLIIINKSKRPYNVNLTEKGKYIAESLKKIMDVNGNI